jgi:hypothetical protein
MNAEAVQAEWQRKQTTLRKKELEERKAAQDRKKGRTVGIMDST